MRKARENRNCPYCLSPIGKREERVRCPKCGVLHHAECWRTNGQCSVYGCDGWAQWSEEIAERIAPAEPGTIEIGDTRAEPVHETARCIDCGRVVRSGQIVCAHCRGQQSSGKWQNCSGPSLLLLGGLVWLLCITVRALT